MPLAVLEAMAAKKPVVATRVGAIRKMVNDKQTGLLVDAGDITGLQSAISLLLGRRDLCRPFGQSGHDFAKTLFSPDSMAKNSLSIYRRVIPLPSNTANLAHTVADRT